MAKNPQVSVPFDPPELTDDDGFDMEVFLEKDLRDLPPPQQISGPWMLRVISTFMDTGIGSDGNRYKAIDLRLKPEYPVGDDAELIMSELNMRELTQFTQRFFITTDFQQQKFVENIVDRFGVPNGKLKDIRVGLRGARAVGILKNVTARGGKDAGKLVPQVHYFRKAPAELPPE